jgi:uncharacterized repeat protein (TIGR01451 family)
MLNGLRLRKFTAQKGDRRLGFRPRLERLEDRATPATINLTPVADDTLYQVASATSQQLSNGIGQHFYVGETAQGINALRRGAIRFDLSAIPAGSTIGSVTLTLNMSRSRMGTADNIVLHRALLSWGEGTSDASRGGIGAGEGDGVAATTGDVTWFFTSFNSQRWTTPGGDFVAAASATTRVATVGQYQWAGPGLVADVQQWLSNPATNFGWILTGNESAPATSKQFDTRENSNAANQPSLTIVYTPPAVNADLTIAKTHTGVFRQGDAADTYTITVSNVGAGPTAGPVTVTDTLPAGLSPTAADNGTVNGWAVSFSGQTITATRSDVLNAAAGYPALTLTVSVAANAPASVTNTATVAGGGDANTANNSDSDQTPISPAAADLTIAKTHTGTFRQGDAADTYMITVSNVGSGPTVGAVTVTDTLPAGLSPTSADNGTINGWSVSFSGQTITAMRSDALAGSAAYPTLTLTVGVAANAAASVTNTATVSGGGEANAANNSASDVTPITQVADLTISKTHQGTFRPGDTAATYSIVVSNVGGAPTTGPVTVTDVLPAALAPTAADNGTINGWTVSFSGQTVTATRSDALAAGTSFPAFILTVSVASTAPPTVANTATVAGGGEVNTANNSSTDVTPTTPVADLAIAKSAVGTFHQGDAAATYRIVVSNVGSAPTSGTVTVTDMLPAGLAPTAADNGAINGWTVSFAGQTVTATRSDALAAGVTYADLVLTVRIATNAPASVTNTATVAGGGEVITANDSATNTTAVTPVADLTIAKTHTGDFHPGDRAATYTITVSNVGGAPTVGAVTVTDTLPVGLAPTAADSGSMNGWAVSFSGQTIIATRSDALAAGGSYPTLTLTVSVAGTAAGTVTNTATVAGGGEVNTANNSATDVTRVTPVADLAIAMSHTGNFSPGGTGTFLITVGNVGGAATTGVVTVVDVLPTGLTYSGPAAVNGWNISVNGQTVTATRSDPLAAGAVFPVLALNVTVASNAPLTFSNTATVSGGGQVELSNDAITDVAQGQDPRRRGA